MRRNYAAKLSDGHRVDRTCDSPATSFAEPFNNASFPSLLTRAEMPREKMMKKMRKKEDKEAAERERKRRGGRRREKGKRGEREKESERVW